MSSDTSHSSGEQQRTPDPLMSGQKEGSSGAPSFAGAASTATAAVTTTATTGGSLNDIISARVGPLISATSATASQYLALLHSWVLLVNEGRLQCYNYMASTGAAMWTELGAILESGGWNPRQLHRRIFDSPFLMKSHGVIQRMFQTRFMTVPIPMSLQRTFSTFFPSSSTSVSGGVATIDISVGHVAAFVGGTAAVGFGVRRLLAVVSNRRSSSRNCEEKDKIEALSSESVDAVHADVGAKSGGQGGQADPLQQKTASGAIVVAGSREQEIVEEEAVAAVAVENHQEEEHNAVDIDVDSLLENIVHILRRYIFADVIIPCIHLSLEQHRGNNNNIIGGGALVTTAADAAPTGPDGSISSSSSSTSIIPTYLHYLLENGVFFPSATLTQQGDGEEEKEDDDVDDEPNENAAAAVEEDVDVDGTTTSTSKKDRKARSRKDKKKEEKEKKKKKKEEKEKAAKKAAAKTQEEEEEDRKGALLDYLFHAHHQKIDSSIDNSHSTSSHNNNQLASAAAPAHANYHGHHQHQHQQPKKHQEGGEEFGDVRDIVYETVVRGDAAALLGILATIQRDRIIYNFIVGLVFHLREAEKKQKQKMVEKQKMKSFYAKKNDKKKNQQQQQHNQQHHDLVRAAASAASEGVMLTAVKVKQIHDFLVSRVQASGGHGGDVRDGGVAHGVGDQVRNGRHDVGAVADVVDIDPPSAKVLYPELYGIFRTEKKRRRQLMKEFGCNNNSNSHHDHAAAGAGGGGEEDGGASSASQPSNNNNKLFQPHQRLPDYMTSMPSGLGGGGGGGGNGNGGTNTADMIMRDMNMAAGSGTTKKPTSAGNGNDDTSKAAEKKDSPTNDDLLLFTLNDFFSGGYTLLQRAVRSGDAPTAAVLLSAKELLVEHLFLTTLSSSPLPYTTPTPSSSSSSLFFGSTMISSTPKEEQEEEEEKEKEGMVRPEPQPQSTTTLEDLVSANFAREKRESIARHIFSSGIYNRHHRFLQNNTVATTEDVDDLAFGSSRNVSFTSLSSFSSSSSSSSSSFFLSSSSSSDDDEEEDDVQNENGNENAINISVETKKERKQQRRKLRLSLKVERNIQSFLFEGLFLDFFSSLLSTSSTSASLRNGRQHNNNNNGKKAKAVAGLINHRHIFSKTTIAAATDSDSDSESDSSDSSCSSDGDDSSSDDTDAEESGVLTEVEDNIRLVRFLLKHNVRNLYAFPSFLVGRRATTSARHSPVLPPLLLLAGGGSGTSSSSSTSTSTLLTTTMQTQMETQTHSHSAPFLKQLQHKMMLLLRLGLGQQDRTKTNSSSNNSTKKHTGGVARPGTTSTLLTSVPPSDPPTTPLFILNDMLEDFVGMVNVNVVGVVRGGGGDQQQQKEQNNNNVPRAATAVAPTNVNAVINVPVALVMPPPVQSLFGGGGEGEDSSRCWLDVNVGMKDSIQRRCTALHYIATTPSLFSTSASISSKQKEEEEGKEEGKKNRAPASSATNNNTNNNTAAATAVRSSSLNFNYIHFVMQQIARADVKLRYEQQDETSSATTDKNQQQQQQPGGGKKGKRSVENSGNNIIDGDVLLIRDGNGDTPIHAAIQTGAHVALSVILKAFAPPPRTASSPALPLASNPTLLTSSSSVSSIHNNASHVSAPSSAVPGGSPVSPVGRRNAGGVGSGRSGSIDFDGIGADDGGNVSVRRTSSMSMPRSGSSALLNNNSNKAGASTAAAYGGGGSSRSLSPLQFQQYSTPTKTTAAPPPFNQDFISPPLGGATSPTTTTGPIGPAAAAALAVASNNNIEDGGSPPASPIGGAMVVKNGAHDDDNDDVDEEQQTKGSSTGTAGARERFLQIKASKQGESDAHSRTRLRSALNAPNMASFTAIHLCVMKDDVAGLKLLLAAGADPSIPTSYGKTPLEMAKMFNAKAILDAGLLLRRRVF